MPRVYASCNWMIRRVEGHTRIVPTKGPYAVTDGPSDLLNDRILKNHAHVKRLQVAFRHLYVGELTKCYSLLRCAEGLDCDVSGDRSPVDLRDCDDLAAQPMVQSMRYR